MHIIVTNKNEPEVVVSPIDNPTDVIGIGEKVTNPKNIDWCKDPQADATLSSMRHISDVLYTMDYNANLHLDELANGNYRTRDAFENAFGAFHFEPQGAEPTVNAAPTACSGFVCRSPQGGLLLGRNFDGAHGPMLLLFNGTNGYKYIQATAPNYNSVLYMGADGLHGDGVLSDGKTPLHRLMRVPLATMDGMNEHGLCFGAYQLPGFDDDNLDPDLFGKKNPDHLHQNTGKSAISANLMHNLILSKCKTEKEALLCLQEGRYNIEVPNDFTNWSCVYNPKELTLIFALRNDLSKVYTVDLKKVFK